MLDCAVVSAASITGLGARRGPRSVIDCLQESFCCSSPRRTPDRRLRERWSSVGQRSVAERLPAEWNRRVRAGASSGHPSRYRKTKRGSEFCDTHHNHYSFHIHSVSSTSFNFLCDHCFVLYMYIYLFTSEKMHVFASGESICAYIRLIFICIYIWWIFTYVYIR